MRLAEELLCVRPISADESDVEGHRSGTMPVVNEHRNV
jgi:hypothetical protein